MKNLDFVRSLNQHLKWVRRYSVFYTSITFSRAISDTNISDNDKYENTVE